MATQTKQFTPANQAEIEIFLGDHCSSKKCASLGVCFLVDCAKEGDFPKEWTIDYAGKLPIPFSSKCSAYVPAGGVNVAVENTTASNPFESAVQAPGQDLLDEGFAQIQEEVVNGPDEPISETEAAEIPEVNAASFGGDDSMSETFSRGLPVFLSATELGEYSTRQAELFHTWVDVQNQKKESAKMYGERIKKLEEELLEISNVVREGSIDRPIECRYFFDYTHGVKRLVRLDSQTVVEELNLTVAELQRDLFTVEQNSIKAVDECFKKDDVSEIPDGSEAQEDLGAIVDQCEERLAAPGVNTELETDIAENFQSDDQVVDSARASVLDNDKDWPASPEK